MAKSVKINGVTYSDVPYITIPLSEGKGDAKFMDTDGATGVAGDLREGKTAYVSGALVTGTVPAKAEADVTVTGKTVSIPAGIYDAAVEKAVADGAATPNATVASDLLGDTETDYAVTITPQATVTSAGYIESIANGAAVTKYIQVEAKTVDPSTEVQTIAPAEGKLINSVTVNPVVLSGNATAADVMAGKTFYNNDMELKTGTATVPVVGQDPDTKALEIA